jgi:hypothetical protein
MKKISLMAIMLFIFASVASASSNGYVDGHPIVKVVVGGVELAVSGTPAIVYGGNTLIPVNMLREMGFEVTWDAETYTATVVTPPPVIITVTATPTPDPNATPAPSVEPTPDPVTGVIPIEDPTSPDATVTPTAEPTPAPAPSNAAACKAIRDSYTMQIFTVNNSVTTGKAYKVRLLEYNRDAELAAAGCS